MVLCTREVIVLSAVEGDTFRMCVTQEGGFLGHAYNVEDVSWIRDAHSASTGFVVPTGPDQSTDRGHPDLHRRGDVTTLHPAILRRATRHRAVPVNTAVLSCPNLSDSMWRITE